MPTDSFHARRESRRPTMAEQRAKLVQCFMYTEGPPKPNLTTGMREHRVARGLRVALPKRSRTISAAASANYRQR